MLAGTGLARGSLPSGLLADETTMSASVRLVEPHALLASRSMNFTRLSPSTGSGNVSSGPWTMSGAERSEFPCQLLVSG